MNLDDLKAQLKAETVEVREAEAADTEQDLSDAICLLEDCGKFLETVGIGMKLGKNAKQEVEGLCEEIYAYLSQYDTEDELVEGEIVEVKS